MRIAITYTIPEVLELTYCKTSNFLKTLHLRIKNEVRRLCLIAFSYKLKLTLIKLRPKLITKSTQNIFL